MLKGIWNRIKTTWQVERAVASWELSRYRLVEEQEYTDLQAAIQFLPDLKDIMLVAERREHIPYIRRSLFKLVGEPSRSVGNEVYYGRHRITFVAIHEEDKLRGVRDNKVFMVETY